MTALRVSVIIVSRGRPHALRRCLAAVALLDHPAYEVIVVADAEGVAAAQATGLAAHLKIEPFAAANISAARNAGIARAAGDIVAFVDDDAVPEPRWLAQLCAPFEIAGIAAAGGFVRGRNGISFQWRARGVDACARTAPLRVDPERRTLLSPP
ncbi:MAG: glycosyltransferase family 2 protein, partial [Paracoccaceae bacterium]